MHRFPLRHLESLLNTSKLSKFVSSFGDTTPLFGWLYDCNPCVSPNTHEDRVFEIEGVIHCTCGKEFETVLRFPHSATFDFVSLVFAIERGLTSCCCNVDVRLNYFDDVINPYMVPIVSVAISHVFDNGIVASLYDEETVTPLEYFAAGLDVAAGPEIVGMMRDYSCFELTDIINAAIGHLSGKSTPNVDKMMCSDVDMFTLGVAPERALFEAGRTYVEDPPLMDDRMLQLRSGFFCERSRFRQIEHVVLGMCCAITTDHFSYIEKIFALEDESADLRLLLRSFVSDHLNKYPGDTLEKYAKTNIIFPSMRGLIMDCRLILESRPWDYSAKWYHGEYKTYIKTLAISQEAISYHCDVFEQSYSLLCKARISRRATVVLDTVFKPCSSIETWAYGNAYSTIAKWKHALNQKCLSGLKAGTIIAAGCGAKNWWKTVVNAFSKKCGATVTFIDTNRHDRSDVVEMNVEKLEGPCDVLLSDVQVMIEWDVVFPLVKKCALIKLLPAMWRKFSSLCSSASANGFELGQLQSCGRMHNGEMIAIFLKGDGKKRLTRKSLDESIKLTEKIIRVAMSDSMVRGEHKRRHHLRCIFIDALTIEPPQSARGEYPIDHEIVKQLKRIHRKRGGMARWQLDVGSIGQKPVKVNPTVKEMLGNIDARFPRTTYKGAVHYSAPTKLVNDNRSMFDGAVDLKHVDSAPPPLLVDPVPLAALRAPDNSKAIKISLKEQQLLTGLTNRQVS